jgi:hypothetical protein
LIEDSHKPPSLIEIVLPVLRMVFVLPTLLPKQGLSLEEKNSRMGATSIQ